MRATRACTLVSRRPSYSLTELMAFADLELPYIPFHFPKPATEASWASNRVAPTPLCHCSLRSFRRSFFCHIVFSLTHDDPRRKRVLSRRTGPSDVRHHIPVSRSSLRSRARRVRPDRYDGVILGRRLVSGRHRDPLAWLHGLDRRQSALRYLYANREVLVGCLRRYELGRQDEILVNLAAGLGPSNLSHGVAGVMNPGPNNPDTVAAL